MTVHRCRDVSSDVVVRRRVPIVARRAINVPCSLETPRHLCEWSFGVNGWGVSTRSHRLPSWPVEPPLGRSLSPAYLCIPASRGNTLWWYRRIHMTNRARLTFISRRRKLSASGGLEVLQATAANGRGDVDVVDEVVGGVEY
jgi:hypothetical protein